MSLPKIWLHTQIPAVRLWSQLSKHLSSCVMLHRAEVLQHCLCDGQEFSSHAFSPLGAFQQCRCGLCSESGLRSLKTCPAIYRRKFWIIIEDCICRALISKEFSVLGSHHLINPHPVSVQHRAGRCNYLALQTARLGGMPGSKVPWKEMLCSDNEFDLVPILSSKSKTPHHCMEP